MSDKYYGLIEQLPCGRIRQIGMTKSQQTQLQFYLSAITNDKPMVNLPEKYDLVLKSEVSA